MKFRIKIKVQIWIISKRCVVQTVGDIAISPLAICYALGILLQASGFDALMEIEDFMHLDPYVPELHIKAYAIQFLEHRKLIFRSVGPSKLYLANRIYATSELLRDEDFSKYIDKYFKAQSESLNFKTPKISSKSINNFVQNATHGQIQQMDLLTPADLETGIKNTILLSATYFKGKWEYPIFTTAKRDFYISATDTVSVDFMFFNGDFNATYIRELKATALDLKLANSNLTFMILLPERRSGLHFLERKLKLFNLMTIPEKMQPTRCDVVLPKFAIEFEIRLDDILKHVCEYL